VVAIALLAIATLISSAVALGASLDLGEAREEIARLRSRLEAAPSEGVTRAEALEGALRRLVEEVFAGQPSSLEELSSCLAGEEPIQVPPPGGLGEQIDHLIDAVEALRKLTFQRKPKVTLASPARVQELVERLFLGGYDERSADIDARILGTLGAVPPGIDLRAAQQTLLQVGGFYVPQTGHLYVRKDGSRLGRYARLSLVHELEHALADQVLGLPTRVPGQGQGDAARAALSVVEGDAVLTTQRYVLTLPVEDQVLLAGPSLLATAEPGSLGLPYYLEQERVFPYVYGLPFVCGLYAEGGWEAVNEAYDDPPNSTAEILFPEQYQDVEIPLEPRPPGRLPGRWKRATVEQFGVADLLWLFEAPGDDPSRALDNPIAPLDDWGGGELHLWTEGSLSAVGISLAERKSVIRSDLCDAVQDWYRAAFPAADEVDGPIEEDLTMDGDRQDAVITCAGQGIRIGIAPTLPLARDLVG
jgi:hypothetical protein